LLAFLARELGAAVGLLPSVSSLPVSAVKRKRGGLIDMTYILSLGDDGSACRLKANILVRVKFLCMSVLTRGRHGGVS
jgi:hypothetical protein